MSSDFDVSARVRAAHERMSRSLSDAESDMKNAIFAEHTTILVSPAISTPHTVSALVVHGGSSSPSAPTPVTPSVEHLRLDDSDGRVGSKMLKLSELGNLPICAPTSVDVNLSSDDMRVQSLLERIERERVANKSIDLVLSRIAGWVSDEQFLVVAGLDGPARSRVAYELLKLGQSQNDIW